MEKGFSRVKLREKISITWFTAISTKYFLNFQREKKTRTTFVIAQTRSSEGTHKQQKTKTSWEHNLQCTGRSGTSLTVRLCDPQVSDVTSGRFERRKYDV